MLNQRVRIMGCRSDHSQDELYEMALAVTRGIIEVNGLRVLTARNVADVMGYRQEHFISHLKIFTI